MSKYLSLLGYLLLAVNTAAFTAFGVDKLLAIRKKRRIPELTLLLLCFLFGSLGGLLGMVLFRHKTNVKRHPHFVFGVPTMLLLQLAASFFFVYTYG